MVLNAPPLPISSIPWTLNPQLWTLHRPPWRQSTRTSRGDWRGSTPSGPGRWPRCRRFVAAGRSFLAAMGGRLLRQRARANDISDTPFMRRSKQRCSRPNGGNSVRFGAFDGEDYSSNLPHGLMEPHPVASELNGQLATAASPGFGSPSARFGRSQKTS